MSEKTFLNLNKLPETALITLWAKGVEYARTDDALLRDAEAARLLAAIDYDFSKFEKAVMSQVGCCARAALIDDHVCRFLERYPDAVVIQLGCGLDARYERLGKPPVTAWYDLDLPEMIQIRSTLLPPSGNRYLEGSLFDTAWTETVTAHGKPVLVLLEGVLMYFDEDEVRRFFVMLAERLSHAEAVFDSIPPLLLRHARRHDALRKIDGDDAPEFRWAPKDMRIIESYHKRLRVADVDGLTDICLHRYPWFARQLYRLRWTRENGGQRVVHVVFQQLQAV